MALSPENDADFYKLFNGKHEIHGEGKAYDIAITWLLSSTELKTVQRRVTACTIFSEHPREFLTTGVTKTTKLGDGKGVDAGIVKYLPKHPEMPKGSTPEETENIKRVRGSWPEAFRTINFSAVNVISLLAWEWKSMNPKGSISTPCDQLYLHFGCGPETLVHKIDLFYPKPVSEDETKLIRLGRLTRFVKDNRLWQQPLSKLSEVLKPLAN